MKRVPVCVLPSFFFVMAAAVLMIPFRWLLSWLIAAVVHEICHLMAIHICGLSVGFITIGGFGAVIHMDDAPGRRLALCSLAGPLGGLLLMLAVRIIPRIALCAFVQSLYNLLPIYPLDGGQVVAGLLTPLFSTKTVKSVLMIIKCVVAVVLTVAAIYATAVLKLGIFPVVFAVAIIIKNKNIPCKPMPLRVQ